MTNMCGAEMTVTVDELATRLMGVLAEVQAGSRIIVTSGGEQIARIEPVYTSAAEVPASAACVEEEATEYGVSVTSSLPSASPALIRMMGAPALRAVLGVFVREASAVLHQREIARRAGVGLRSAQLALKKLESLGLLVSERDGNRLNYQVVRNDRFEALRRLMARELGVVEVLAGHLAAAEAPIARAFIFGSVAAGTDTLSSDIDLLVVSDASADAFVDYIAAAQRELGREVDLVHYRVEEFARRRREGNHFIRAVLGQPRLELIGTADDA